MNLNSNKLFFSSDNHFCHRKIIQYSNRPFSSSEEMDEQMIQKWNESVSADSTIFCLGDFCFGNIERVEYILTKLNGNIHMITGNHDKNIITNKRRLLENGLLKEITPYKEIYVNDNFLCLFHYAARTWNKSHYGSWYLFGHTHGTLPPMGKSVDVGVDSPYILGYAPYRPFSFKEVKEFMDKQEVHEKF